MAIHREIQSPTFKGYDVKKGSLENQSMIIKGGEAFAIYDDDTGYTQRVVFNSAGLKVGDKVTQYSTSGTTGKITAQGVVLSMESDTVAIIRLDYVNEYLYYFIAKYNVLAEGATYKVTDAGFPKALYQTAYNNTQRLAFSSSISDAARVGDIVKQYNTSSASGTVTAQGTILEVEKEPTSQGYYCMTVILDDIDGYLKLFYGTYKISIGDNSPYTILGGYNIKRSK